MVTRPMRIVTVVVAAGACLCGAGCQSLEEMAPPVTGSPALVNGRDLFVTRCATCHGVTPVAKQTFPEWEVTVAEMAERSKLTPGEQSDILRYLRSAVPR